jgi:hypothetical protein
MPALLRLAQRVAPAVARISIVVVVECEIARLAFITHDPKGVIVVNLAVFRGLRRLPAAVEVINSS